jgi:hypothetical protein
MRALSERYVQTILDEETIVRLNLRAKQKRMTRSKLLAQIVCEYLSKEMDVQPRADQSRKNK